MPIALFLTAPKFTGNITNINIFGNHSSPNKVLYSFTVVWYKIVTSNQRNVDIIFEYLDDESESEFREVHFCSLRTL